MSRVLRTPDDRFAALADWPYAPRYVDVPDASLGPLRLHYVDEGPAGAPPVLLLHGEPTWSFLYRRMIGPLAAAGHRVVAPDLVGFGRSGKPAERASYTYASHVAWLGAFLDALRLDAITLFCQDWGGLLGLRLVGEQPQRFARVIASNTWLPTGDAPATEGFLRWRGYSQKVNPFVSSAIVRGATKRPLAPGAEAGYDAPFPDDTFLAGARAFPLLVPVRPDDPASEANRRAWQALERFDRPFITAFSDGDPVTRGLDAELQQRIPGARGQPHATIRNAGHFVQEDAPGELVALIDGFGRGSGR